MAREYQEILDQVMAVAPKYLKDDLEWSAPCWSPELRLYNLNLHVQRIVPIDSTDSDSVAVYAALVGCSREEMKQRMEADERKWREKEAAKDNELAQLRVEVLERSKAQGVSVIATVPEGVDELSIVHLADTAKRELQNHLTPMRVTLGVSSTGTLLTIVFAAAGKISSDECYLDTFIRMATEFGTPIADILAIR